MDVDMDDHLEEPSRRRNGPRLYHKKSRKGCLRCKQRRVKCDEAKPSCTGCSRHGVDCVYPNRARDHGEQRQATSPTASTSRLTEQDLSPPPGSSTHGQTPEGGHSPRFTAANALSPITSMATTPAPYPPGPLSVPSSGSTYQPQIISDASSSRGQELEDDDSVLDPPESRERRIWELRLLSNYLETVQKARPADPSSSNPSVIFLWTRELPMLAMTHDSILYGMLAHSALNLWTRETDPCEREQLRLKQQTYLGMAVREQRTMVGNLAPENADALCMSSLIILSHAFALVQMTLPPEGSHPNEWQPPLEWLRIGRGTGAVFTVARAMLPNGPNDNITRFLNTPPHFDPDEIFLPENRASLQWVIVLEDGEGSKLEDREAADKITWRIYERVLSYTGWVQKAVDAGEANFAIHRRLAAFSVWMPEIYQDFCQQRRQRALVTLAWFFGLWVPYDHMWTINGSGARELKAIYENLEPRWRPKVEPILTKYGLL